MDLCITATGPSQFSIVVLGGFSRGSSIYGCSSKMPIELILVISFGILTSLVGLFQLCIAIHKYCVWCQSLRTEETVEISDLSQVQSTRNIQAAIAGSASSSGCFLT